MLSLPPCDCNPDVIDLDNLNLECPRTWALLQSGLTRGVFQLETPLGRHWVKKCQVNSINDLSDLVALLRPGCLASKVGKRNIPEIYAARKVNGEPIEYLHPKLEPILKNTQGVLVYQEQAMSIAKELCGFSLEEADTLRKAIGKKLPEEMAKVKKLFLSKAIEQKILSESEAETIFDWIEKSQKYSFNKGHSISYAMLGYWSAYIKAHRPLRFYQSWLNFAKWKIDPAIEAKELVQDAKSFDIKILPPKFMDFQKDTYIDGDCVRFGLLSVKKVGETQLLKLITEKSNLPPEWGEITSWPWLKFLVLFSDKIRIDAFKNLINVGAFDQFGMSRKELQFQVEQWVGLTEKEKSWVSATVISGRLTDLKSALLACARPKKEGGGAANINRIARLKDLVVLLENPPINLADDPYSVAAQEQALLGVSLSYDELDLCKKPENTWTCSKLQKKKPADRFYMTGKLTEIKEYVIKNGNSKGKTMFFIKLADKTGEADNIVAFPYIAEKFCAELVEGNTILIGATYNPDRDSVVIDKVWNL